MFGQPTSQTHSYLLKEGEVVPGIKKDEFKRRRYKFMEKIAKHNVLSDNYPQLVLIPSASKVYMSDKIPYVFRQNSDFLYFTGCQEPDSILLLTINGSNYTSTLFMRPKDAHAELWDGPRTGVEAAISLFEVEQALPVSEFEKYMTSVLNQNKKSVIWYDADDIIQPELHKKLGQLLTLSQKQMFTCPKTLIHQFRLIKSEAEIKLMKKSCDVASAAIATVIEKSKPGINEHQLFATVDYQCRMKGAEFLAYPPVVAGGRNANIIHYIANNQIVCNNEMVLMDAGCEYHGYSSDITRTWPINGKFTPYQRILYEIVLDVQKILIDKLKEMPSLDMVYHDMCNLLGKRLQEECLIPKDLTGNKLLAATYLYCPHHVGHYLGMDVHDTPKISRSIRVQPGMIVTVEPGIYVNPKNQYAPLEFHNFGIRIEDDVLIQDDGPVVLSQNCPKETADVEALARKNQS
ncbi:xaa-Pro aminopeptidase 3 isoform X2 [Phymastichus coffea]|nr:xaa-Pro aminopeptidase 3 isoform X2 [Phymastichus coffea]